VRVLVDMANLRGGPDNITAIAARILAVPSAETEHRDAQPIADSAGTALHPALWGVMALCLLAALGLAGARYYIAALISALVAAATGVMALVYNTTSGTAPPAAGPDGPLGSGPHASFACAPNAETVAVLCQMAQQLRDAAKDEHWTLDWARFNDYGEQAQAALAGGDCAAAVRQYALAISFMMSEIRRQPAGKDHRGRSVLDL
jgi:PPM family protein phosphatase